MNKVLQNKKIIPFKKEGLALLENIQRKIKNYEKNGYNEWADEYKRYYNDVLDYVSDGLIPKSGFSENLRLAYLSCVPDVVSRNRYYGREDNNLRKAVNDANEFFYPMPLGSIEAFYAICTSSTHTSDIRSKVDYNDPVYFARALQEPLYRDWYSYCRFQSYVIERGESLNLPFKITRSDDATLIIGKGFDFNDTVLQFSITILDLYKRVDALVNKSYSKNLKLDIFVIDNHLDFRSCINEALARLNGVMLSKSRELIIQEILEGDSNDEWYIPNYRATISDTQDLVECYLTFRFIPLPSFSVMITYRAQSLHRLLNTIPKHPTEFPNILINTLKNDLSIVRSYRDELRDTSDRIDLSKYQRYINRGRIPGLYEYNCQMNWNIIPKYIFTAVYELLETYNHYQTLDGSTVNLPEKLDVSDDLQEHIFRSLQNFGRDTSNYLNEGSSKGKTFKNEKSLTTKLVTYLDNHKDYIAHGESEEGAGRLDIKIEYKYSKRKPLMIEVKLFKIPDGKININESEIHKIFDSSVRQIEHYTDHSDSVGMLLFFTLDLNEGQIAQVLEKKASNNGFSKIPKCLRRNKINYVVEKAGRVYPIRFMKLSSKPPSKG